MHVIWEITIGQIVISIPILWLILYIIKIYHMLLNFRVEHEILMQDWAARQNPVVHLHNIPTRQKKWW